MGLFSAIFLAPLLPVRGVIKLAEVIQQQVEGEMNNPARRREQLEQLEEMRQRGEISEEEEKEAQAQILGTMISPAPPQGPPPQPRPATRKARRARPQAGTAKRRSTSRKTT